MSYDPDYAKRYQEANRKRIAKYLRAYRKTKRKEIAAYQSGYQRANREPLNGTSRAVYERAWRTLHKDRVNQHRRKRYRADRERFAGYQIRQGLKPSRQLALAAWRVANRDQANASKRRMSTVRLTPKEITRIVNASRSKKTQRRSSVR